ncbi:YncE family protein [Paraburkholderia sprentiae WSM5005]|uniref:YncE family protein n=1 Tax=Paraburkholderia sprentiae WSM5005 TaxID=754502 RepID=A0A1L1P7F7_9BURK|nr:YncE family protein [Paraburkholderia sprentiae]APA88801.1 YncE family protein [Paraburkholderia sprentiae WSM5005]
MRTLQHWGLRSAVLSYLVLLVLSAVAGVVLYRIPPAAAQEGAHGLPLTHVADIPLPGRATRLDYESYDPVRHLLFIAHLGDGEVIVFDVGDSRVIARIAGVSSVHGVLAIPDLARVFASATGTDQIVAIDEATLKIVARMPGGHYPDGMAYAPEVHKLYVSNETGNTETVIDVRSNQRVATIPLGGEVGNTQYDPRSHHIFVNVQSRDELIEIDPAVDRIVARFRLPGSEHNHGLLIDAQDRLAFIACQGNDKLLVFDLGARRIIQSFGIGSDPDVLAFDPAPGTLYVAGEAGIVSMFSLRGANIEKIGEGRLGPNAHVVAIDPTTHHSFFALKDVGGRPVLRIMSSP